jgi:hypothetical protein
LRRHSLIKIEFSRAKSNQNCPGLAWWIHTIFLASPKMQPRRK